MSKLSDHQEIIAFIKENPVAVLGTIGQHGEPHGAPIYVCHTAIDQLYFVTKIETQKFKDILHTSAVSLTIVDTTKNETLQAVGHTHVIKDAQVIEMVMGKLARIYTKGPDWLPPIAKLRAGPYQVVGIKLKHARLARFMGHRAGSEHIFKEG